MMKYLTLSALAILLMACGGAESEEANTEETTEDTAAIAMDEDMDTLTIDQREKDIIEEVYDMSDEDVEKILDNYPDVITDRQDMRDIVVYMGLSTYDAMDPGYTLHNVFWNEDKGKYQYNPCWDDEGTTRIKVYGDDEFNKVSAKDHPSLFHSYSVDRYWQFEKFEKQENDLRLWFKGAEEFDAYRSLRYMPEAGCWAYFVNDEGDERYMVSDMDLHKFEKVEGDCE